MPTILKRSLALIAAGALGLSTLPALADSTSSASSASSASVGSSSPSLEKSSNSSSTKEQVAQGNYTIVEMTALTDQPDRLRLRLQPVTQPSAQEFVLLLPRQAAERGHLATGKTIAAEHRPYGLALAALNATGGATPFFLVLDDDWYRELDSRPVTL